MQANWSGKQSDNIIINFFILFWKICVELYENYENMIKLLMELQKVENLNLKEQRKHQ